MTGLAKIETELTNFVISKVHPDYLIPRKVVREGNFLRLVEKVVNLNEFERIHIFSIGKASCSMLNSFRKVLGVKPHVSLAVIPNYINAQTDESITIKSSHPLPDKRSLYAADTLIRLLKAVKKDDLVFFLISGGASSLIEKPIQGISLRDIRYVTSKLLKDGANIVELNKVRIGLSSIKGGLIMNYLDCKQTISLVLSDVPFHDDSLVGSGLTFYRERNYDEISDIMEKYNISRNLVKKVKENEAHIETEKQVTNINIGSNTDAVLAAKEFFETKGFKVNTGEMLGEASLFGKRLSNLVSSIKSYEAFVFGGETTVTVKGNGRGGRNQEVVLSAIIETEKISEKFGLISFSTDGKDGPTDAAGAFANKDTLNKARKLGLDAREMLLKNDSYNFFKRLKSLVKLGYTGTNVADISAVYK